MVVLEKRLLNGCSSSSSSTGNLNSQGSAKYLIYYNYSTRASAHSDKKAKYNLKDCMFKLRETSSKEKNAIHLPSAEHDIQFCIFLTRTIHTRITWLGRP